MPPKNAFTLLELIVVIAIIAIFAAIAIPNLTFDRNPARRSKVSRVLSDQRALGTAIELYRADSGVLPPMIPLAAHEAWDADQMRGKGADQLAFAGGLTTPVAYLTVILPDALAPVKDLPLAYFSDKDGWLLISPGQDGDYDISDPAIIFDGSSPEPGEALINLTYDATNGTQTSGDIWRKNTPPAPESQESDPTPSTRGTYSYDPTNGTVSKSEVWRVQQETQEPAKEESDAKP